MPTMTASIPHQLTRAEAKRRIQDHMSVLRTQHGAALAQLRDTWTGDAMDFSVSAMGQSVSGHLTVDDQMVHVEVALPWFLSMLAGTLQHRIEHQGRRLLTGPPK